MLSASWLTQGLWRYVCGMMRQNCIMLDSGRMTTDDAKAACHLLTKASPPLLLVPFLPLSDGFPRH